MSKNKPATPIVGKAMSFAEMIAEAQQRARDEQARFDAMSADEQADYIREREAKQKEIDAIVAELSKDSGFMQVRF